MKIEFKDGYAITKLIVTREKGDRYPGKESTLFYHIKQELQKMGYDVIVKDPSKDQLFFHLTGAPYYIRSRKPRKGARSFWVIDGKYALRDAAKCYRESGEIELDVEYDIFDGEETVLVTV